MDTHKIDWSKIEWKKIRWGEVLGDEPVLNLDVFTPKRPEYAP